MLLLFASQNQEKLREVRKILNGIEVLGLKDIGDESEVEETGNSFRENAYLKAQFFYQKYKQPVFADDSGLVVPALGGEPGNKIRPLCGRAWELLKKQSSFCLRRWKTSKQGKLIFRP